MDGARVNNVVMKYKSLEPCFKVIHNIQFRYKTEPDVNNQIKIKPRRYSSVKNLILVKLDKTLTKPWSSSSLS